MSLANYLLLLVCFGCTVFGFGLPLALRLTEDALEQVTAAAMIGLVASFVLAFGIYAAGLSWWWFTLAPAAGLIGLSSQAGAIRNIWSNPNARQSLIGWLLVAAWTQALTATIRSYSGGAWGCDWLEHHQRALFFHDHWSLNFNFVGDYLLPARPPLANVVTAGFQALTQNVFACGQAVLALWSSLVFFPLALFFRRLGGGANHLPILALLLMLNPSFTQNSTYAWTKLPAAFFVLVGAHFLLDALDRPASRTPFVLAATALTAALLTHYSAGPYCIVLAGWWLLWRLQAKAFRVLGVEALAGLLVVTPLLGLWFGWALLHYGPAGTFLSNSTVMASDTHGWGPQLVKIAANLRDTLVPHPLRAVNYALIDQPTRIGWFRDYFFLINQVNLPALLGTGGLIALACSYFNRQSRDPKNQPVATRSTWVLSALALTIILGVAAAGARDEWGLAHICLQPISLLGLTCLAARIDRIGRVGGVILGLGLIWDAVVNIGLHYALQSRDPDRAWLAVRPMQAAIQYGVSGLNASLKHVTGTSFLRDSLPSLAVPLATLLIVLVSTAIWLRCATRGPQPRRT